MSQARQLQSQSNSFIKMFRIGITFICLIIILALGSFFVIRSTTYTQLIHERPIITVHAAGAYKVIAKPSITANLIDSVLSHYNSPALGKGQVFYDYGKKYGIDPAYALAFFMHESSFGTEGVARVTHSLGNIRASEGYQQYQGYRSYKTWEEGFEDWYQLIAKQYVEQWNLSTIDQIIPVYAPASDNNDEAAYIHTIKVAVETWRKGFIEI